MSRNSSASKLTDIDYGVLDVTVSFRREGHLIHMYLLHYFALTERYDRNCTLLEGYVRFSPRSAEAGCDPSGAHD